MATLFTRIIQGELPGRFVWRDPRAVAFLTIAPLQPGHTLVVPIQEVDHWLDLEPELCAHLMGVAYKIGKGVQRAFQPVKVALMIAGLEVPHTHLHLVPIWKLQDMNFANADAHPSPESLDRAAEQLRQALRELGYSEVSE